MIARTQLFMTIVMCLLAASLTVSSARGADAPVGYPKAAPVFTIDPSGAGLGANPVEQDGPAHPLHILNADGSNVPAYTLVTVPVEKSLEADLEKFIRAMTVSMKFSDAKYATDWQTEQTFETKSETATGMMEKDKMTATIVGFRMKDKNFFAMAVFGANQSQVARLELDELLQTLQEVE